MAGGFWGGVVEGITEGIQKNKAQSGEMNKLKYASDREEAMAILKAVMEGSLEPAGEGETPAITMSEQRVAPKGIGDTLMQGFGLRRPQYTKGQGFVAKPNVQRQLQAENLRYMRNINKQMAGGAGTEELIYRDATGREISPDVAQADIAKGNTNYYISRKDISKGGIKEAIVSKPEDLEKSRAISEKSQFILDQAQDSLDTIAEIKKGMGYFGAGSLVPAIPTLQPEKMNWQVNVNKLLSGKMIDLMTKMKEASKTGATGFGQLSEKEGQILKEASTALKKTLSPKDAQRYLNIMEKALNKIISAKSNIQPQAQLTDDFSQMSDEELRRIVSGGQ